MSLFQEDDSSLLDPNSSRSKTREKRGVKRSADNNIPSNVRDRQR